MTSDVIFSALAELTGTFCLLLIGIGSCLNPSSNESANVINYPLIGLKWGLAIFIANMVGLSMGSNKFNPVFSLLDYLAGVSSVSKFFLEVISQLVGASLAMVVLHRWLKKKRHQPTPTLTNFAPIPAKQTPIKNASCEIIGTGIMVCVATILPDYVPNKREAALIMSVVMGGLIRLIAPITGASFNPVRDAVPRAYYAVFISVKNDSCGQQIWVTSLMPVIGGGLGYWVAKLLL